MDYGTRLADINSQIGKAQGNYNTVNKQAGGAYNQFNDALRNAKNYGDIYGQARNQYMNTDEINAARDASNNARNAVDQVNTTINKLPESIRQQYGGTGLTEAQRQRALSTQYQDMSNTYNMLNTNYGNARQDYSDLVNRAMAEVQNVAGGNYQSQQDRLGALQSTWGTLLGQSNEAYNRILNNRGQLNDVYGQKMTDENAAATLAFQRWAKEQDLARARESENAQLSLQKYLAGLNSTVSKPERYESYTPISQAPRKNVYNGNRNVVDTGGIGGLVKQGFQNAKDYGPLALFGGGSLWR